jgi:hypothetical protein
MTTTTGQQDVGMLSRRAFLSLPALLPLFVSTDALAAAPPAGAVEEVRGTATAELDQDRRMLTSRAEVYVGEKISTAERSRIELRLGLDTKVRLGDMARIKIDRFQDSGGEITLEEGPLLLDKPSRSAPQSVQLKSPFGIVTVRGSKIFAGPNQGEFGILVIDGNVTVEAAGRSIRLQAGEGTNIKSPGAAPSPARRWAAARVKAALASVD